MTSVAALRRRRPPARIVHLGLGAFARAHPTWYTQHAADADEWGIAAFTGRTPRVAELLDPQDEVYTLIERGSVDAVEAIDAVVSVESGADDAALAAALADPAVALATLTITEQGYAPGSPTIARLAAALDRRRWADAGPIALVPCDNLPGNGAALRARVLQESVPELAAWIEESVSFVSTVVDRITPATTQEDLVIAARLIGADDAAPVVTEPYSAWVLAGEFPRGRPEWEAAGAEFVDDVEPAEHRKLWMLNGAHSLLAYRGLARGHATVAEAMDDPVCADEVDALWDEAGSVLPYDDVEVETAASELRIRFGNARIEHRLAQIALDGSVKLPIRILDPLRARLRAGLGPGVAQCAAVAAWADLVAAGEASGDPLAEALAPRLDGTEPHERARLVLDALAPDLAADDEVTAAVADGIRIPSAERSTR